MQETEFTLQCFNLGKQKTYGKFLTPLSIEMACRGLFQEPFNATKTKPRNRFARHNNMIWWHVSQFYQLTLTNLQSTTLANKHSSGENVFTVDNCEELKNAYCNWSMHCSTLYVIATTIHSDTFNIRHPLHRAVTSLFWHWQFDICSTNCYYNMSINVQKRPLIA